MYSSTNLGTPIPPTSNYFKEKLEKKTVSHGHLYLPIFL